MIIPGSITRITYYLQIHIRIAILSMHLLKCAALKLQLLQIPKLKRWTKFKLLCIKTTLHYMNLHIQHAHMRVNKFTKSFSIACTNIYR